MESIETEKNSRIELFENELQLKTELQKDRLQSIHKNISLGKYLNHHKISIKPLILARKEELRSHVIRIQRHEADILDKMKIMLEQVNITKDQADLIVTRLKNLDNPQTSKYIPKFVAARKEKDLVKVKEEIDEELDAIISLLQENYDKFMKLGINQFLSITSSYEFFSLCSSAQPNKQFIIPSRNTEEPLDRFEILVIFS